MDGENVTFCQLVRIFVYRLNNRPYAFALVQPFKAIHSGHPDAAADRDLGLCRVRLEPRHRS